MELGNGVELGVAGIVGVGVELGSGMGIEVTGTIGVGVALVPGSGYGELVGVLPIMCT